MSSTKLRHFFVLVRRFAAAAVIVSVPGLAAAEINAVGSIPPVHGLLAALMEGVGTPRLLVRGGSPHAYALRPSDAAALTAADLVVRVGPGLETFLDKALHSLAGNARTVELIDAPGVTLRGGHEVGERGDHEINGEADDHDHDGGDPHIWLDPENARTMARAITGALVAVDPENEATYLANRDALDSRLQALTAELAGRLAPVTGRAFVTFHDAYRHFIGRFGLKFAGAVAVDPSRRPGAARLREIRQIIADGNVICVFAEPQFRSDIVDVVVEGTPARAGVLDPLGTDVEPGPDQYFELMRQLATDLVACLKPES